MGCDLNMRAQIKSTNFFQQSAPASLSAVKEFLIWRYKTYAMIDKEGAATTEIQSKYLICTSLNVDGPRAIVYLGSQHFLGSDLIYYHP